MNLFAKDSGELAKLMVEPSNEDNFERNLARTYLVGNGNCGAYTTGYILIYGVDQALDDFTPEG